MIRAMPKRKRFFSIDVFPNGDGNDCVLNMTQGEVAGAGQLDLARDHRLHYFHNLGEDLFGAVQCVHMFTFR